MKHLHNKPKLRKAISVSFIVIGVAGLIVPLIPGWLFLGPGLFLFSIDSPRMREKIHHYRTKHSAVDRALKRSYDKLHAKHAPTAHHAQEKV